jgi:hypothetical protein
MHKGSEGEPVQLWLRRYALISTSAGSLLILNEGIRRGLLSLRVSFPAPLAGMLLCLLVFITGKAVGGPVGGVIEQVIDFYGPLRDWVARWMPVFFVPSLVVLPQACAGIGGAELLSVAKVTAGGWLLSLCFAVFALRALRALVHSEISPEEVCLNPTWVFHFFRMLVHTLLFCL